MHEKQVLSKCVEMLHQQLLLGPPCILYIKILVQNHTVACHCMPKGFQLKETAKG